MDAICVPEGVDFWLPQLQPTVAHKGSLACYVLAIWRRLEDGMENPLSAIDRDPQSWLAGAEAALNILEICLQEQGALALSQKAAIARVRMLLRRLVGAGAGAGDGKVVVAHLAELVELIA